MAVRISFPISVPFSEWVTSAEHCWITLAARRGTGIRPAATRCGRARASARTREAGSAEIRSPHTPQDDREGGRRKKNSPMSSANNNSAESSMVVAQYETLRGAALGEALPPEARTGLLLFLRRGMCGWARAVATMCASERPTGSRPPNWRYRKSTEPSFISLPPWPSGPPFQEQPHE